jgi:cysteine desulfurase
MHEPIYLDYNATTPVAPEVADAVDHAVRELWGNPSSNHMWGRRAREAVDQARASVAALIGCEPDEVIFTGGGTESDNAAILGVAEATTARGRHVVISAVEHAAVDRPCRLLESRGYEVTRIGADEHGRTRTSEAAAALRADTVLVSVVHAQNETGVLQPVREIAELTRARGLVLHTDAAQSAGKIAVDVRELGCDLLTVAGHKLYAPKGVGALYVRRGTPFAGLLRGANHESGRRAGTENVPGIVGLGVACELARRELPARTAHLTRLRDRLERTLLERLPALTIHGAAVPRLPNTTSVAFPGMLAADLAAAAPGIALSLGAACHSARPEVSHVLRAMGVPDEIALGTLRLSVGSPTTPDDIDHAAAWLIEAYRRGR